MITIKSRSDIRKMAQAGRKLSGVIQKLKAEVKMGITTEELNQKAERLIQEEKAKPAFKGYDDFPATLCTSVNEGIVHQVPSDYQLQEGDLLSLDLGLKYQGFYADMAFTVPVGTVSKEVQKLTRVTREALSAGIQKLQPGHHLGDVEHAIQKNIETAGFTVVQELCGHGIGRDLHEDPNVLNVGQPGTGISLKEGMVLCLEPMAALGQGKIKQREDGYSYVTVDKSTSAHFEQMVAVTDTGPLILTEF